MRYVTLAATLVLASFGLGSFALASDGVYDHSHLAGLASFKEDVKDAPIVSELKFTKEDLEFTAPITIAPNADSYNELVGVDYEAFQYLVAEVAAVESPGDGGSGGMCAEESNVVLAGLIEMEAWDAPVFIDR